jgi:arsenite methyltransferase
MSDADLPVLSNERRPLDVDEAVRKRYAAAARAAVPALCTPVSYEPKYLAVLPAELIERDYGCGNPSSHLAPGETVLDLGSGGGKVCYIASQVVGPAGRVIGVDVNDEMLALARRFQPQVASAIGHDNVRFHKGRIQDLALDLDVFQQWLEVHPVRTSGDWLAAQAQAELLRRTRPMIADTSVDVVVSNCVLNLVQPDDRRQLFAEMFRVLKPGGRAVISDITSDEPVPERLQRDPDLWSGCISGAHTELGFLTAFEAAGFAGLEILERQHEPWAILEGIEFRSLTVRAYKVPMEPGSDRNQAVIYRGPWRSVTDDAGRVFARGARTAVGDRAFAVLAGPPYIGQFVLIAPRAKTPETTRLPKEGGCCGPEGCA